MHPAGPKGEFLHPSGPSGPWDAKNLLLDPWDAKIHLLSGCKNRYFQTTHEVKTYYKSYKKIRENAKKSHLLEYGKLHIGACILNAH